MATPITNYFQRITVSGASFGTTANVILYQGIPSISLVNEGTGTVEYSFDGSTLHGDMVPSTPSAAIAFNNQSNANIWFRLKSGSASDVRVEAGEMTISIGSASGSGGGGGGAVTVTSGNITVTNAFALDATAAKLTISPGTALGSNTVAMMGGSVTTAAPSYTTGQINPLSLTTTGALRTDSSATTQPVSGTITANLSSLNGAATSAKQDSQTTLLAGGLPAALGAGGGLKIDGSGTALPVSGTVAISTALALDATLAKLTISQGAALGSNTQALMGGSVTTAAPTYTTGQISPLSLTTGGLLRVDASATTVTVDSELPAAATLGDTTTNPSTTSVGSLNLVFNGSTWDRAKSGTTTATSTVTGMTNTINLGIYNSSAPTPTTGQVLPIQLDSAGNTKVAEQFAPGAEDNTNNVFAVVNKPLTATTYVWSVAQSSALEASRVVKASAGNLRAAIVRLDSTATTGTYYIQFLNASSLPADGAVTFLTPPIKRIHTSGADDYISVDFTDNCINASTGIVVVLSTSEFTKVISSAWLSIFVLYK